MQRIQMQEEFFIPQQQDLSDNQQSVLLPNVLLEELLHHGLHVLLLQATSGKEILELYHLLI